MTKWTNSMKVKVSDSLDVPNKNVITQLGTDQPTDRQTEWQTAWIARLAFCH